MAYYLPFDGVNDRISLPTISRSDATWKVELDLKFLSDNFVKFGFFGSGLAKNELSVSLRPAGVGFAFTHSFAEYDSSLAGISVLNQRTLFEVVYTGSALEYYVDSQLISTVPASGIAFNGRTTIGNQQSQYAPAELYGLRYYSDSAGTQLVYNYDPSASYGTGELVDTASGNNGTPVDFPTNFDDALQYYDDSTGGGGVEQAIVLSNAVQAERATALNISQHQPSVAAQAIQRESASPLIIEALQQVAAFNAIQAETAQAGNVEATQQIIGTPGIQNESAAPLNIEQAGAQNITLVNAVQAEKASTLSVEQHQTLQGIIAVQLENAGVSPITEAQAITLAPAVQNETATALNIDQYSGQLITLISATQKETASALFISSVNVAELRPATQNEVAQQHQVTQHQQIIQVNAVQREVADILHILTSGDMTDLTGLRLVPITETYSLNPINHVTYTLREL